MKHIEKTWYVSICATVFCFWLWFASLRFIPVTRDKANSNSITVAPATHNEGNVIRNREIENPETAKSDWLSRGVWLKNAQPSPMSFSPNGQFIVGGHLQASLWDARTGENKGVFGESLHPNKYIDFQKVSFLSDKEVALLSRHDVTIFDLSLTPIILPPSKPTYLSIGYCGPMSNDGAWTYTYDIYDKNIVNDPSMVDMRLRFWDFRNANFTHVLSPSLVKPVFIQASKYDAPVTIKNNRKWLVVRKECGEIFVLDEKYKKIWSEDLKCPQLSISGKNNNKSTISDFEVGGENIIYLLDMDRGLRQVDLKTGKENEAWHLPDSATSLSLSNDDNLWAFGSKEGRLIIVDATTHKILHNSVLPFSTEFLTFSPDSSFIAVGGLVVLPIPKIVQKN